MKARRWLLASAMAALAFYAVPRTATAVTESVGFDHLTESATVANPLNVGDTLFLNTLVTTEVGALLQSVTFTVGAGVSAVEGFAAWEVTSATGSGPRLVGVNVEIFDASNALVVSDTFAGVLASFAHSTLDSPLGPGTYKLVATGTGVRTSSLDVSLTFVPEPSTGLMLMAGLVGIWRFGSARRETTGS